MARPTGGRAGKMPALPSAQESLATVGKMYGFGPRQTMGALGLMGGQLQSPFSSLPVAASGGEFFETISLIGSNDTMKYYNPQDYDTVSQRNLAGTAIGDERGDYYYVDEDGAFVDKVTGRKFYDLEYNEETRRDELVVPGSIAAEDNEAPAKLTVVPTSSSNPARPRTVAAGYDRIRQVITVVFRDGTFYNYYEVTAAEWQAFKARVSKGRYIYQYLDFKPRGPADMANIPGYARTALYKIARTSQLQSNGKQHYRGKTAANKTKKPRK